MSISTLALLYGACMLAFFALDFVWLSVMTSRFYKARIGHLMAERPKLGVAAVFYLLYILGIVALAVVPGLSDGNAADALWRGAMFGFLAYATYDLTNMATLKDWPWQVTVVDLAWGTVLTSCVSLVGYWAGRSLGL